MKNYMKIFTGKVTSKEKYLYNNITIARKRTQEEAQSRSLYPHEQKENTKLGHGDRIYLYFTESPLQKSQRLVPWIKRMHNKIKLSTSLTELTIQESPRSPHFFQSGIKSIDMFSIMSMKKVYIFLKHRAGFSGLNILTIPNV